VDKKLTQKQELFCQAYVETGNASEAYRRAYNAKNMKNETLWPAASKLLADYNVSTRVDELKAEHVKRHEITVDTIREMLLEDRDFARKLEAAGPAITATTVLAKLYGLITDKQQVAGHDGGALKVALVERRIVDPVHKDT
jgi:phage terminase small subunit